MKRAITVLAIILSVIAACFFAPGRSHGRITMAQADDAHDSDGDAVDAKEGNGKENGAAGKEVNEDADEDAGKDIEKDEEKDEGDFEEKKPAFKLRGYAKDILTFHRTDNFLGDDPLTPSSKNLFANLTRVRLSPEFKYRDYVYIIVDYDNELAASNYNRSRDFDAYWRPSGYNDLMRLTWEPVYNRRILYRTKVHRAYAKFSVKHFTATVGRQQIRFGSGRLWNPLDILNPLSPTFLEGAEEQKGTDALRLDFFPADTTEISIVYNPKRYGNKISQHRFEQDNYVARIKTAISDIEFAVLGGYISERGVAGFDMSAVVFKGMLRGSVICAKPKDERIYFQANGGYEYTFKNGIYFLAEYFFNQNGMNYGPKVLDNYFRYYFTGILQNTGASGPDRNIKTNYFWYSLAGYHQVDKTYLKFDNYTPLANQFITVNQHYVAVALGYDFMPLLRGDIFLMCDIQGRGIFASPLVTYNALTNLDISAGMMMAFVFDGKTSDFNEFRKNYLYYLSAKYSF